MPTISVLIDAKVDGLGQVGELDASVQRLGASTTDLGGSLDSTTGKLNAAGAAHAATATEVQALGADLTATTAQVEAAGAAHVKTASATENLGATMGQAANQAEAYAAQTDGLTQKLETLQGAGGLGGVDAAATQVSTAVQDLASAQASSTAATTSSIDATAASQTALTDLAVVDASVASGKKASAKEIAGETVALEEAKKAHEEHTEAVLKGVAATGEFGEAGVQASEKLGVLSGIIGGAGGVSAGLAAFVVGAGAAVAAAQASIESFLNFGEEVLKFEHVTGMTAESSSKLLDVFEQLGVSADAADSAMFQLSHRTEDVNGKTSAAAKTLESLGVEIVKNKDGSTDLEKTLFNVADAYSAAASGADKDAIAYAAFGKQAQALAPVLEQGSTGLEKMTVDAQRVFTQEQLDQVHRYNVEMATANQEISRAGEAIGGKLVPAIGNVTAAFTDDADGVKYADAQQRANGQTVDRLSASGAKLAAQGRELAAQQRENADAAQAEADAAKRLNDQLAAEEQNRQALLDSDNASLEANLKLQHAAENVTTARKALADETLKDSQYANQHQAAVDKVASAQLNYTAAVKAHGVTSLQAKEAQDKLNAAVDASKTLDQQNKDASDALASSQLQLKDAMLADSQAARDAAEKQAELAGGHLSAQEAAAAQADELQKLKDAAGGKLPAELQQLLDELNSFHDVSATVHLRLDDQTGGQRFSAGTQIGSAEGGVFTRPTLTWVGEAGPEAIIPLRQGNTMPGAYPLPGSRSAGTAGLSSMDETNELLAEQNAHLAAIRASLAQQPFSNRAWG